MLATAASGGVSIDDPADHDYQPEGDIRHVGVVDGGEGALVFTMQVEKYTDPLTTPSWATQDSDVEWYLGTGGDVLTVAFYVHGTELRAGVFEGYSLVCGAVATSDPATRTYSATVAVPGCFGDAKRLSIEGIMNYENYRRYYEPDFAPNDAPVSFDRPTGGQATGGYAVVSRRASFQRFGAIPPGPATPGGTVGGYTGPAPVVGAASARLFDPGLWSVTDDGVVSTQDGAEFYGDARDIPLAHPIVGMAVSPDRLGYWLVGSDGGVFAFGRAGFLGSTGDIKLDKPIVGMAATLSGGGYWLVAADGGIFNYGDAFFFGSTGNMTLDKPVVGMARAPVGQLDYHEGYWLVASDGGIFAFNEPFYGSTGAMTLAQPIVGMAATRSGAGYRFIARDGGVFNYGDAEFHGSGATPGRTDVIGIATA